MESRNASLLLSTRAWTYDMRPSTQKNEGPAETPRSRRNSCFGHSTFAHLPGQGRISKPLVIRRAAPNWDSFCMQCLRLYTEPKRLKKTRCLRLIKPYTASSRTPNTVRMQISDTSARLPGFRAGLLRGHAPTEKGCSSEVAAVARVRGAHPGHVKDYGLKFFVPLCSGTPQ